MKEPPRSRAFSQPRPFILPAIDLRAGRVVRLIRGDAGAQIDYGDAPMGQARRWMQEGAGCLHVIDLGGAFKEPDSSAAVLEIAAGSDAPVQAGGGIRDEQRVDAFLNGGVARVILGTRALLDPAFLKDQVKRHGDARIVLAMDVAAGRIRVSGWTEASSLDLKSGIELAVRAGARHLLVTAIDRDGTLAGPNLPLLEETLRLAEPEGLLAVSAGGIGKLEDVEAVLRLGSPSLEGVVIGRALYEGTVDLGSAIRLAERLRNS